MGRISYYVSNGGDGSVSVRFFDDETLAEYLETEGQQNYDDGWAEPSVDTISEDHIQTRHSVLWDKLMETVSWGDEKEQEQLEAFVVTFFGEGIPEYQLTIEVDERETRGEKGPDFEYDHLLVMLDGVRVDRIFKNKEQTLDIIQSALRLLT